MPAARCCHRGQDLTFEERGQPTGEGTLTNPFLRLFSNSDLVNPVAQNDDSNSTLNSLITYTPTTSGYYVLQAGAYNDLYAGTYVVSMLPGYTTGSIAFNGERDRYQLHLVGGRNYTFEMLGTPTGDGTLTDPYLRLYNTTAPSTVVTFDDDAGVGYNSLMTYTPSADGFYIVEAGGWADIRSGTYTLSWTDTTSSLSQSDMQKLQNANDTYEVVLTKAPVAGTTVTVTVTPEITKTTRTGGIRHDAVQVSLSSSDSRVVANPDGTLSVTFNSTNWDAPVTINVAAIDDNFVDGGDTKVFAPGPHTVSGILGPVTVDGGGGQGSLVGIPAPVKLPGETNVKPKTGDVVSVNGTQAIVLAADITAALGAAPFSDLLGKTLVTAVTPATNTTHSAIPRIPSDHPGHRQRQRHADAHAQSGVRLQPQRACSRRRHSQLRDHRRARTSVSEATQVDCMFVDEDSPPTAPAH